MGARGNSGVILLQIVRGVADVLGESTNGIDATPRRSRCAVRPTPPTARCAGRWRGRCSRSSESSPRRPKRRARRRSALGELLVELVRHGDDAVARTPEQLEVSARGRSRRCRRSGARRAPARTRRRGHRRGRCRAAPRRGGAVRGRRDPPGAVAVPLLHRLRDRGRDLDRDASRRSSSSSATHSLVVGDETALKVHVHTDDPGVALSLGTAVGHDRRRRDREHARPDGAARGAAAPPSRSPAEP